MLSRLITSEVLAVSDPLVRVVVVSYRIKVMMNELAGCWFASTWRGLRNRQRALSKVLLKGTSTAALIGRDRGQLWHALWTSMPSCSAAASSAMKMRPRARHACPLPPWQNSKNRVLRFIEVSREEFDEMRMTLADWYPIFLCFFSPPFFVCFLLDFRHFFPPDWWGWKTEKKESFRASFILIRVLPFKKITKTSELQLLA